MRFYPNAGLTDRGAYEVVLTKALLPGTRFASALKQEGFEQSALELAYQLGRFAHAIGFRKRGFEDFADIDPFLLGQTKSVGRTVSYKSTYLAMIREAVASDVLGHEDFRVRDDVIDTLFGCICDTDQLRIVLREILSVLAGRHQLEPEPWLRDRLLACIDLACKRHAVTGVTTLISHCLIFICWSTKRQISGKTPSASSKRFGKPADSARQKHFWEASSTIRTCRAWMMDDRTL